jgi:hypothetical protein
LAFQEIALTKRHCNVIQHKNGKLLFEMERYNIGAAPVYTTYQLRGKLIPISNTAGSINYQLDSSGN